MIQFDASAWNREIVLENGGVFGSVNANRKHYELAAKSLAQSNPAWLRRLITARSPLSSWPDAFEKSDQSIKNILLGPAYGDLS